MLTCTLQVGHTVRRCPIAEAAEQQPEMDLMGGTDWNNNNGTTGEGGEGGGGGGGDVGADADGW